MTRADGKTVRNANYHDCHNCQPPQHNKKQHTLYDEACCFLHISGHEILYALSIRACTSAKVKPVP